MHMYVRIPHNRVDLLKIPCTEYSKQILAVVFKLFVKSSKMAHFVFKCNKEDYLSLFVNHMSVISNG